MWWHLCWNPYKYLNYTCVWFNLLSGLRAVRVIGMYLNYRENKILKEQA